MSQDNRGKPEAKDKKPDQQTSPQRKTNMRNAASKFLSPKGANSSATAPDESSAGRNPKVHQRVQREFTLHRDRKSNLPYAIAASAALTSRSFSDAENRRRVLGGALSTDDPLTARSRSLRSLSEGKIEGSRFGKSLGTFGKPFSAHRYRDIQRELSHVTLAQRASLFAFLEKRAEAGETVWEGTTDELLHELLHDPKARGIPQGAAELAVAMRRIQRDLMEEGFDHTEIDGEQWHRLSTHPRGQVVCSAPSAAISRWKKADQEGTGDERPGATQRLVAQKAARIESKISR